MPLIPSWVASANNAETHFPLNNLPYGVFVTAEGEGHCCVAIGDQLLDLAILEEEGVIDISEEPVFDVPYLNEFMELGPEAWQELRDRLTDLLADDGYDTLRADADLRLRALIPQDDAVMAMPFVVTEFTDFYAGRHHATNVGTMFRGAKDALPPNWLHMPIGYNGRASTVVVSGTDIVRPKGQLKGADFDRPIFAPSRRLDFELELGAVVGTGNRMGQPVTVQQADDMIFGYVLLNDWSARDIQAWEYQPLGPFQAKAFATSISPWVVTKAALEPFRCATPERDQPLLPYLRAPGPMLYDIGLEAWMQPDGAEKATRITQTNFNELYYSAAQQLCHHTSSGCAMNTGDLLGSGTISGPERENRGSLLELAWGGKEPLTLETGEQRSFLQDGDSLTLTGAARGDGFAVGFGSVTGKILPAVGEAPS